MNKLTNKAVMDGYDVQCHTYHDKPCGHSECTNHTWRVYRYEKPNVGKPVKVYKFGYPDYKSMIKKHPELK